jgi:hypothetical protein
VLHLLRSRLSLRIAGALLLGSLVPVLGAALLALRRVEESVRNDAERRERVLAQRAATLVEGTSATAPRCSNA